MLPAEVGAASGGETFPVMLQGDACWGEEEHIRKSVFLPGGSSAEGLLGGDGNADPHQSSDV